MMPQGWEIFLSFYFLHTFPTCCDKSPGTSCAGLNVSEKEAESQPLGGMAAAAKAIAGLAPVCTARANAPLAVMNEQVE